MSKQGAAGKGMKHFGQIGMHARSSACSQNDDIKLGLNHISCNYKTKRQPPLAAFSLIQLIELMYFLAKFLQCLQLCDGLGQFCLCPGIIHG